MTMTTTLPTRSHAAPAPATAALRAAATSMARPGDGARRAVVVQSGARDAYQLALALEEAGMLEALVTDLFWPADRGWARALVRLLPARLRAQLAQRTAPGLPSARVQQHLGAGLKTLLLDRLPRVPAGVRRRRTRATDAMLGQAAGRLARRRGTDLISYSYYGYDAFTAYGRPATLFQLHPHPASMRRILGAELAAHPDCAASLEQEWELSLPEEDFQHLVRETAMAADFLCASSFTRATLIENGAPAERIRVVPYGVDSTRFRPDPERSHSAAGKLRLLFVGRINQRKGIKYLLEALRLLNTREVELTVCGRVVDGLELFRPFADRVRVRPSVSAAELVSAYQRADLFVFPSVAEGFGQVLLEALSSGLPILSTTRTAAPDLITHGREGLIVTPSNAAAVAEQIEWALTHRQELAGMRSPARARAEHFTWRRFRADVVEAVTGLQQGTGDGVERVPRGGRRDV